MLRCWPFFPAKSATFFSASASNFRGPGYSGLRSADYRHGGWHQQTGHVQNDDKLPVSPENEEWRGYKLVGRECALLKQVLFFSVFLSVSSLPRPFKLPPCERYSRQNQVYEQSWWSRALPLKPGFFFAKGIIKSILQSNHFKQWGQCLFFCSIFFILNPDPIGKWSGLTCAYFQDGWLNQPPTRKKITSRKGWTKSNYPVY